MMMMNTFTSHAYGAGGRPIVCSRKANKYCLPRKTTVGRRFHVDDLPDDVRLASGLHVPEPVTPPRVAPARRQEPLHPPLHRLPTAPMTTVAYAAAALPQRANTGGEEAGPAVCFPQIRRQGNPARGSRRPEPAEKSQNRVRVRGRQLPALRRPTAKDEAPRKAGDTSPRIR